MPRYRTERHVVNEGTVEFRELNGRGLLCRNLRNVVVFITRQHFFRIEGKNYTFDEFDDCDYKYLKYRQVYDYLLSTDNPDFRILPANVAQDIIRRVIGEWSVYKKLLQKKRNGEYDGYVGIPGYSKVGVPYNAIYMRATLSKKALVDGIVNIPKSDISIQTKHAATLHQVNVSYSTGMYFIDVVYENKSEIPAKKESEKILSIDCGVNNFAAIAANFAAFTSILIDGKEVKSINRYYNKKISEYKERQAKLIDGFSSDEYTRSLWAERHRLLDDIMHLYSRRVLDIAIINDVSKIVIGHSDRWKDNIDIGKINNQKFAFVPFNKFIEDLKYKAEELGITVILQEESYTSQASFFDDDFIATYGDEESMKKFHASGKRIHRGLYRIADGKLINADINGALNILKKYLNVSSSEILPRECIGRVMVPVRLRFRELKAKGELLKKLIEISKF